MLTSPKHFAFVNRVLYTRLTADRISVQQIGTPFAFEDRATLALNSQQQIIAIGANAASAVHDVGVGTQLVNVFAHPRILIADSYLTTLLFRYALAKAETPWLWRTGLSHLSIMRPIVIAHPQRMFATGLTAAEVQTLHFCLRGAGARQVYIWTGVELMPQDILSDAFPGDQWYDAVPPWAQSQPRSTN